MEFGRANGESAPANLLQAKSKAVVRPAAGAAHFRIHVPRIRLGPNVYAMKEVDMYDTKEAIILYAWRDATEQCNMLNEPKVIPRYAADVVIRNAKK